MHTLINHPATNHGMPILVYQGRQFRPMDRIPHVTGNPRAAELVIARMHEFDLDRASKFVAPYRAAAPVIFGGLVK